MKIIEKECPCCGAGLKFDSKKAKNIVCEYCGKTLLIQKDNNLEVSNNENVLVSDNVKVSNMNIFDYLLVLAILLVVAGIFLFPLGITKYVNSIIDNNETNTSDLASNLEYDFSLYNIHNGNILNKLNSISLAKLEEYNGKNIVYDVVQKWSYKGMYLLVSKDKSSNILYVIYEKIVSYNDQVIKLYSAVEYSNVGISNGKFYHSFDCVVNAPILSVNGFEYLHGFESNEALFNNLVRSKLTKYNYTFTENLYSE